MDMKKTVLTLIAVLALIAMVGVVLVACTPKDLDSAKKKMEKAGYTCASASYDSYQGCDGSFTASRGGLFSGDKLIAMHFESKEAAKKAYNNIQGDSKEDQIENLKQDGQWVYYGSNEAIKAFEK